jgi:hypothetical protein
LLVQLEQQAQALRGEWEQHRQQLLQWVEEAEALLTAKQVGICVSLPRGLTTLLSPFVDVPWQRCGKAWCSWRTLSAVQCSEVQYSAVQCSILTQSPILGFTQMALGVFVMCIYPVC